MYAGLLRGEIKESPEYDDTSAIGRNYDARVRRYYGKLGPEKYAPDGEERR